jgi:AraC-like DNA-binding protein
VKKIRSRNSYQLPEKVSTGYFIGNDWRLILVEEGSATYQFEKTSFIVKQGSLFLLSPNKRKIITGNEDFKISIIFYDFDQFVSHSDILEFKSREQSYRLLREIFSEIHSNLNEDHHLNLLNSFMHIFLRDSQIQNTGDERIRRALQIIQQQNGWRLSSDELAKKVDLSRAHFYSLFKAHTTDTYAVYCRRLRMEIALTLIQEYGLSSKQVALEIGSSSSQAFSREFKVHYGRPVSQFFDK